MQGLQLAKEYFFTHGLPMIEESFKEIADRVAAGLVGPGSECYGFDDALSRDHDWGPAFACGCSRKILRRTASTWMQLTVNCHRLFPGLDRVKPAPARTGAWAL